MNPLPICPKCKSLDVVVTRLGQSCSKCGHNEPAESPPARNEPTPDQRAALLRFRQRHGRRWKEWLRLAWQNGNYPVYARDSEDACLLQQIRNTLGPTWLDRWKP